MDAITTPTAAVLEREGLAAVDALLQHWDALHFANATHSETAACDAMLPPAFSRPGGPTQRNSAPVGDYMKLEEDRTRESRSETLQASATALNEATTLGAGGRGVWKYTTEVKGVDVAQEQVQFFTIWRTPTQTKPIPRAVGGIWFVYERSKSPPKDEEPRDVTSPADGSIVDVTVRSGQEEEASLPVEQIELNEAPDERENSAASQESSSSDHVSRPESDIAGTLTVRFEHNHIFQKIPVPKEVGRLVQGLPEQLTESGRALRLHNPALRIPEIIQSSLLISQMIESGKLLADRTKLKDDDEFEFEKNRNSDTNKPHESVPGAKGSDQVEVPGGSDGSAKPSLPAIVHTVKKVDQLSSDESILPSVRAKMERYYEGGPFNGNGVSREVIKGLAMAEDDRALEAQEILTRDLLPLDRIAGIPVAAFEKIAKISAEQKMVGEEKRKVLEAREQVRALQRLQRAHTEAAATAGVVPTAESVPPPWTTAAGKDGDMGMADQTGNGEGQAETPPVILSNESQLEGATARPSTIRGFRRTSVKHHSRTSSTGSEKARRPSFDPSIAKAKLSEATAAPVIAPGAGDGNIAEAPEATESVSALALNPQTESLEQAQQPIDEVINETLETSRADWLVTGADKEEDLPSVEGEKDATRDETSITGISQLEIQADRELSEAAVNNSPEERERSIEKTLDESSPQQVEEHIEPTGVSTNGGGAEDD
ncbi:hypothetical protein DFJ73DRAFT_824077 [Zopfochytrium polystomum]|nr:hypothetical protein DFJ73DRAFT_824077 [Zopfochytrium polystomum]